MADVCFTYMKSPIGVIRMGFEPEGLSSVELVADLKDVPESPELSEPYEEWATQVLRALECYFAGSTLVVDVPLVEHGTAFQKKVWKALREIPYGSTRTYGEIAKQVGSPRAARAVGGACNANPLLIVTPCHRVVGHNGQLTGFAAGLDAKAHLLHVESDRSSRNR